MGTTPLRRSPLQLPVNSAQFLRTFVYDRAPTSTDWKNFRISDLWIHRNPNGSPSYGYYVLVDKPSQTGVWLDLGGSESGDVQSITGDSGSSISPDASGNVNVLGGSGITTSGDGAQTLTINSLSSGFTWSVDTSTPITVAVGEGHFSNDSGQLVYNLPSAATVGQGFAFIDLGGNGFQVQANAGQTIRIGNQVTSSGGTVTSSAIGDAIFMVCGVEDTNFFSYGIQGNLTLA